MHPLIRNTGRWAKRARLQALRALSRRKAHYNAELAQREIWQERTRLSAYPQEIQIGTNWTCNLRCVFCRRETDEKDRMASLRPEEREIPQVAMERLIDVMPYARVVTLTPLGEPLLYTGLERLLERYGALGCRNLQMTTNGNLIGHGRARLLVESGVRRIHVSIDTADPELYARMRPGGRLDKIVEGLAFLSEWKERLNSELPEIVLAATFMERNIAHLPGLVQFAQRQGIATISVQLMEAEDPIFEPEMLARHIPLTVESVREGLRVATRLGVRLEFSLALRNLLSQAGAADKEAEALLYAQQALDTRRQTLMEKCIYPWTYLVVDTDGEARACCWTSAVYGNLARESFGAVWNSPAAQQLRRQFLANQIPGHCRGKHCRVDL